MPWVEKLYSELSGWVHLSNTHIFAPFSEGDSERAFSIGIGSYRKKVPDEIWEESKGAISAIHEATISMLEEYFKRGSA
jgi:hypothetical protein